MISLILLQGNHGDQGNQRPISFRNQVFEIALTDGRLNGIITHLFNFLIFEE